jgi:hypothetical protein
MRLCVFQLIHIPRHIEWNGSVRNGSQATVERKIGEISHRIRSRKSPFANLANQIYHRELIRLLILRFPTLQSHTRRSDGLAVPSVSTSRSQGAQIPTTSRTLPCIQKHTWTGATKKRSGADLDALFDRISQDHNVSSSCTIHTLADDWIVQRWGKVRLLNNRVLRNTLSEAAARASTRCYRWFEVCKLRFD